MNRETFRADQRLVLKDESPSSAEISRRTISDMVRAQLEELKIPEIRECSVSISNGRRVRITLIVSERLQEDIFSDLKNTLKQELAPLRVQIRSICAHGADREDLHKQSQPHSRFEREDLYRDANRTLPVGIELLRLQRYQIALERGTLDFALLRLHIADGKEASLREWQRDFESRNRIEVFVERAAGNEALVLQVMNLADKHGLIGSAGLQEVLKHLGTIDREPHSVRDILDQARLPTNLIDLRQIPFLTIDPESTRDMEDALYAERLPGGELKLRVAFIDITWFVQPRSALELHAQSLGATLYGSKTVIPTLGREIATSLASFNLNEDRVGWVIDLKVGRSGAVELEKPPYRALVRSHYRLSPDGVDAEFASRGETAEQLELLREVAGCMHTDRMRQQRMFRIKGEGAAYQIVSEAAVAGKRELGKFLAQHPEDPAIFKVHAVPSLRVQRELLRELQELGINGHVRAFGSPLDFAATVQLLQDLTLSAPIESDDFRRASNLMQKMLDIFLTRSRFDLQNMGHHALGVSAYLEIKPRDASGITNQFQLRAVTEGTLDGFSLDEVRDRAEMRNRAAKSYDWKSYELRFFEMLGEKLALIGQTFRAQVMRLRHDYALIDVPGFTKWGVVNFNKESLVSGSSTNVRLLGYDTNKGRFKFELE